MKIALNAAIVVLIGSNCHTTSAFHENLNLHDKSEDNDDESNEEK